MEAQAADEQRRGLPKRTLLVGVKMGKFNRGRFAVVTIRREVWVALKAIKRKKETFTELFLRLLQLAGLEEERKWSVVIPASADARSFWGSEMFDRD